MHRLHFILLLLIASSLSQDEVVIISFPSSGFFIRSDPFLLSCSAINALSIRFRCNHKWLDQSRQSSIEGVDEKKGLRYLQSSINITKSGEESEERCDCYAVGRGERTVKSEKEAVITTAYMRKHFEQTPSSLRIREGSQIALPCVPPLSHPLPTIEWTKDGQLITPDNYRLIASDGSLLLSSARLQDGGSYVCTARNVAGSRASPPALIHVYVDGGWSEWTEWGGICTVDCTQLIAVVKLRGHHVIPRLSRRRLCNNPPPLNGGLTCSGEDEESSPCPLDCSMDGGWSEWEGWSECSSQCTSKRQRVCTDPPPLNGGRDCAGEGIQITPCSSGICSSQWSFSDWIVLVCLLAVFLLLSILFSLCILLLCRQKTTKTNPYYGDIASYKSGVVVESGPPFIQSPLPSMTMMSTKSAYARCESGAYNVSRGGESRQALLLEGSSTASSARKAFLTTTTSSLSEDDNYATVYECVGGGEVVEGECVLPARVDREGGRLSMDKNRTSLLIGEGSLDSPTLLILSTRSPSDDLPMMEDGEIPVSSLISISSSSSILPRFPFILSFSHSIQSIDQWTVSFYSHSHYGWDRYEIDEDNPPPSPIFAHFDSLSPSTMHCTIPHYGKFLLCARPKKSNPVQRMRVAVFTPIGRKDEFPLRVFVVGEGSGSSLLYGEEERGRLVAECPLSVIMDGGPLCLCIEETTHSHRAVNNYTELDLSSQSSHSFQIESIDRNHPFSARLVLLQKGSNSSPLVLSLSLDDDYDQLVMTEDTRVSLDFVLPHSIKQRIASLLDPPSERDWTSLARSLGASPFVVFGRALSSPTTVLLTLWEARRQDPCHLSHALRLSGRPEVAQLVDKCIR